MHHVRRFRRRLSSGRSRQSDSRAISWSKYRPFLHISPKVVIAPSAQVKFYGLPRRGSISLEIGDYSQFFGSVSFVRPDGHVRIGQRCQIGNSQIICAERIEIGDDVLMAWGITIMDNDSHSLDWEHRKNDSMRCYEDYKSDPTNFIRHKDWSNVGIEPVRIERRSWIGFNATILKGVVVGEGAVVAACSVVTKAVAPYTAVAGNPARPVRNLERGT